MSIKGKPAGGAPAIDALVDKTKEELVEDFAIRHFALYQRDPEAAHYWDGRALGGREKTPSLLIVTRGRKSGRLFTRPLIYAKDGHRYVVIGSRGDAPELPSWILNIEADPLVEVQVVRDRFPALATIVGGAQRLRLWELMVDLYPPYLDYQKRSPREIPVVVLSPV